MFRLGLLRVVLVAIFVVMIGRLYQLQLVDTDAQRYGNDPTVTTTRFVSVSPRRGEIFAADGRTLLAESVPIYNIAVVPGQLPSRVAEPERREEILARIAGLTEITSTLALSPTNALSEVPGLRTELERIASPAERPLSLDAEAPLLISVPPMQAMDALRVSRMFAEWLIFENPLEARVSSDNLRRYETVVIREDVPIEMALIVRENANYLPGVEVVESYRRRYPLSGEVSSLSHLLGYTGRINECELGLQNPASSWLGSMVDVISYAPACRSLIDKEIDPVVIGIPPYQRDDQIGKDGLEASYEAILRGALGVSSLQVDALQRPVSPINPLRPVEQGHNLVLTIDTDFQQDVADILQRWIDEGERRRVNNVDAHKRAYEPIMSGVAVVLDPRDGRVLAMVSLPDYDNNVWVDRSRGSELQNLLAPPTPEEQAELARLAPLTNRAVAGQYPPGSTLKQFVGAVALQMGVIEPETQLRDPGLLRLIERSGEGFILPNSVRNRDNGLLNLAGAMRLSSNVFFASIAGGNNEAVNIGENDLRITGLGIDRLAEGLEWFSLGRPTGIDLAGEATGLVPNRSWKAQRLREAWTTGDTYNTAIGQGYLEVTPLQLAVAAGAVAIDGVIYQPQLVERIIDAQGNTVRPYEPIVTQRAPVDARYLEAVRQGMLDSVELSPNNAARTICAGITIAGKTGTAEFGPNVTTADGSVVRQSHSWFVGFAPYDDPQVVVAVLVEGTGDLGDGSSTIAVPAVTQIIQAYFGIAPPEELPASCPALLIEP